MKNLFKNICCCFVSLFLLSSPCLAKDNLTNYIQGNTKIVNFTQAKRFLTDIYISYSDKRTIYCNFSFDDNLNVDIPNGVKVNKFKNRAYRIEWEHVVPAELFGRSFKEWTYGSDMCVKHGKYFKGRKCAETNKQFNLIESDMHNLFPASGMVNAYRSNYDMDSIENNFDLPFGKMCMMKFNKKRVEVPDKVKGIVARCYLYMDFTYNNYFKMSDKQRKIMNTWNKKYPPDSWEIQRNLLIENIQGNRNIFIHE